MEALNDRLLNWASVLDPQTRDQAFATASMPFIYPHLALMPDAHLGKGATVGSVIPTLGAIMPAAVGVDIGCGMMAVRTKFTEDEFRSRGDLAKLHAAIAGAVPLSMGNYNTGLASAEARLRVAELEALPGIEAAVEVAPNWHLQLGSLGSGNHFIEVTVDEEGLVWLFLHSGSRGVGNKLAMRHIKIAQEQCKGVALPNRDLAYLTEGTPEFDIYIRDLRWAQRFALLNRDEMMHRVAAETAAWAGEWMGVTERVNCHHNYTEREPIAGKMVWLSRKGAIDANEGRLGLIPGSMGTASYVVAGKGNPQALWSAPHGAGRAYSRSAAKREFSREQLDEAMKGIVWGESDAFLDEIPQAYKDVEQVMADAADLVEIKHVLHQIVNVKGD
jgi:tRNA-splicing ligase RtcB